jgi:hypothetical protein
MPRDAIFGPFFATLFLTIVVWVYMYSRRIPFIVRNRLSSKQMARPELLANLTPPEVTTPADNLRNLFEVPVIFYALVLYLYVVDQVDAVYVYSAWIFFIFRVAHSFVHCTFNQVILRFYIYAVSTIALWFMVIRAAVVHIATTPLL